MVAVRRLDAEIWFCSRVSK